MLFYDLSLLFLTCHPDPAKRERDLQFGFLVGPFEKRNLQALPLHQCTGDPALRDRVI
jgi:hypothetical protein